MCAARSKVSLTVVVGLQGQSKVRGTLLGRCAPPEGDRDQHDAFLIPLDMYTMCVIIIYIFFKAGRIIFMYRKKIRNYFLISILFFVIK